jgi:hypothetical protein
MPRPMPGNERVAPGLASFPAGGSHILLVSSPPVAAAAVLVLPADLLWVPVACPPVDDPGAAVGATSDDDDDGVWVTLLVGKGDELSSCWEGDVPRAPGPCSSSSFRAACSLVAITVYAPCCPFAIIGVAATVEAFAGWPPFMQRTTFMPCKCVS